LFVYIPDTAILNSQLKRDKKTIWHTNWVFNRIHKIAESDY